MARKKKHYSRGGFTLPLAAVAGFVPLIGGTISHVQTGGLTGTGDTAMDFFTRSLTGYSPNNQGYGGHWNLRNMEWGTLPILVGMLAHKFIGGSLGINRMLGRAKVPVIRI